MDERPPISKEAFEFIRETVAADNYRDLAKKILEITAKKLDADIGTLWRVVEDGEQRFLDLAATHGVEFLPSENMPTYDIPDSNTPNENIEGLTAWIAVRKKKVKIDRPEELRDPNMEWAGCHRGKWDQHQFWQDKSFGSLLGYPLILEDKLLGVIKFERYEEKKPFTQEDMNWVDQWAELMALTLSWMIFREEQEKKRQKDLLKLSAKLLAPASSKYYEKIIKLTAEILDADIYTLWLLDKAKKNLCLAAQHGLNPDAVKNAPTYILPESKDVPDSEIKGLTAWVFVRKRPFFAKDWRRLTKHPSHKGYWDKEQWDDRPEGKFGCLYAVPLTVDGEPIGVLKVERRRKQHFSAFNEVELATFDHIAMIVSVAPPLKAVIRDKDALVLDYFHILKTPVSNAISCLNFLRNEFQKESGPPKDRIESLLNMLTDNLAVAYTQTLNAYNAATFPERPEVPTWRNFFKEIIAPSTKMLAQLYPDARLQVSEDTNKFELFLTDFQQKRLNIILHNLLDNAVAFSDQKPVEITLWPDSKEEWLILSVRDKGIGIPQEKIEEVWEQGVTLQPDAMTRPESRGHGLAIVKNIVDEFGWKKSLESIEGQGTEVKILIRKDQWRYARHESLRS